jgi:hypothetical protein
VEKGGNGAYESQMIGGKGYVLSENWMRKTKKILNGRIKGK